MNFVYTAFDEELDDLIIDKLEPNTPATKWHDVVTNHFSDWYNPDNPAVKSVADTLLPQIKNATNMVDLNDIYREKFGNWSKPSILNKK